MILIVGPVVMAVAVLAIVAPQLFGLLWRLLFLAVVACVLYVVDGQSDHPILPHDHTKSAAVR